MDKKCFRAHVLFFKTELIYFLLLELRQVNHEKKMEKENYMINYVHTIYWMKINTILSPIYILWQEIIKVREWIPHIGPLTKVIRLKLFLDVVPSSSEDITRAMRGQLKQLCRTTWGKNGGKVILYVLVSFHTGDVFCTLSRLFVQSGISFVFRLVWLFIILPFIRF